MIALFAPFPSLNREWSCSLLPCLHSKTLTDATALLIIADEVEKRSPLAETGSAGLLAIVGLRLHFLDLVGHDAGGMEETGGDEEADRACRLLYTFASAYDARCALPRLSQTRHTRVRSHYRPSRAHRLRVCHGLSVRRVLVRLRRRAGLTMMTLFPRKI